MLNNTNITNNIKIQACSGGIYKSHPKSRIVRLHIKSDLAKEILSANTIPTINSKEIVILQIVNAVEGYLFTEYMYKNDYEAENVIFNLNN